MFDFACLNVCISGTVAKASKAAEVNPYRNGSGLEKITKGLGTKMKIVIDDGMKRPVQAVQAAKLASEGGLIARTHMPILPHFKEYKKDQSLVKNYIGKVAVSFFSC